MENMTIPSSLLARLNRVDHDHDHDVATLNPEESWWRDHSTWLDGRGYSLRPRYNPDWKPSWLGTKKKPEDCEDGQVPREPWVLDATRKSDGAFVALKRVQKSEYPEQVSMSQYLSSKPLADDPRNHCCPLYEVLQVPDDDDLALLVMPLLGELDEPDFFSVGEIMECFRQVIEGLQFMHSHNIAHRHVHRPCATPVLTETLRDVEEGNIMYDPRPMFPIPYHPQEIFHKRDFSGEVASFTRTERPVRYYLTNFHYTRRYSAGEKNPLDVVSWGGHGRSPEFVEDPCAARNPFQLDVYQLGCTLRFESVTLYSNLGFLEPLFQEMTVADPAARPTMDEVAERFGGILRKLSSRKLRSSLRLRLSHGEEEPWVSRVAWSVWHAYFTLRFILRRHKALPTPPPSS